VAERIRHFREQQNLTYAELRRRLAAAGRPMPILALTRIEGLERRVDSDDLIAIAEVLGVSPLALLFPPVTSVDEPVDVTGFDHPGARRFRRWLEGQAPVQDCDYETELAFRVRSSAGYEKWTRVGSDPVPADEFDEFWEKGNDDGNH
jgi:transcriptional regulator with XRE-family HTH domain